VIVLFGRVSPTLTVCDCLRPSLQTEKGRKLALGTGVPLRLTASEFGSTVQAASMRTPVLAVVTVASCAGVGPVKTSGAGAGNDQAASGATSVAAMRRLLRRMPRVQSFMEPSL
jgi:hypothetical protein